MADLTFLQKKRKDYIKAQAEKIANYMVNNNLMTDKLATCNAMNWDTELHGAMFEVSRELDAMGIRTSSKVNWGVTDWVFTVKS